jgi:hypothetical protein
VTQQTTWSYKLIGPRKQGRKGTKNCYYKVFPFLLPVEGDTRTGTPSKWRTDVWTGLQSLVKMRKQNVLVWWTTNSDFQRSSPGVACPWELQGCTPHGQAAPVAFHVPNLTALCLHYFSCCTCQGKSQCLATPGRNNTRTEPNLTEPNRTEPNRSATLTRNFLDTKHVSTCSAINLPTSVIPTQRPYDKSDICRCSQYTCSRRGVCILTDWAHATSSML